MSEAELDTLSVAALRTAIRAKLRTGADRETISLLIREYVPFTVGTERVGNGVYRLPVETIPPNQRTAFLDALNQLPGHATVVTLNFGTV